LAMVSTTTMVLVAFTFRIRGVGSIFTPTAPAAQTLLLQDQFLYAAI
jgi:hypothetical protein